MFGKKVNKFDPFANILNKAEGSGKRIVLPEGNDNRVIEAVEKASILGICKPIIIGDKEVLIEKLSKKAQQNVQIVEIASETKKREMYAKTLYELRKDKGLTEEKAYEMLADPMYFATMMLYSDDADGIVSGAVYESAEVMRPLFQIIKTAKGNSKVASCFIMEMPEGSSYGENGLMVFTDCGVNVDPTDQDLAEIAILASKFAKEICSMTPRVSLLSYSSKGAEDIDSPSVQKVKRAYKIARRLDSSLIIDGELQVDASIVPDVAKRKAPGSILEGRANVLVFPDLNSGNIAYKLVQRIAGVRAVGPILMGLRKPANDLSRGANADEIVLATAITALQANAMIKGE